MKDWICHCDGCTKECKGQNDPLRPCGLDEFYVDFEVPDKNYACSCDCCYQQDHVCMNPEGVCEDRLY